MTTASKITLARIAFIPLFMFCLYMSKGVPATNVMQVERAVELIKLANREVATAAQARELLSFPKR